MKIIILTGSNNLHGTSNTLVDEFIKGITENLVQYYLNFQNTHI